MSCELVVKHGAHGIGVFAGRAFAMGESLPLFTKRHDCAELDNRDTFIFLGRGFKPGWYAVPSESPNAASANAADTPISRYSDIAWFAAQPIEIGDEVTINYDA